MEKAVATFMKYQGEMEERFQKAEEERWKREAEMEEKRRQDERQHELQLFQMLGQMISTREQAQDSYHTFPTSHTHYDYEGY